MAPPAAIGGRAGKLTAQPIRLLEWPFHFCQIDAGLALV